MSPSFEAGADDQHTVERFLDFFKKWETYDIGRAARASAAALRPGLSRRGKLDDTSGGAGALAPAHAPAPAPLAAPTGFSSW